MDRKRPSRPTSTAMWEDNDRSRNSDRDRDRDRDSYRERERDGNRDRREQRRERSRSPRGRHGGPGRDRSRSPNRRGGRRADGKRERSRSPFRRDEKDRNGFRNRSPPKGPRGGGPYRKSEARTGGPVKALVNEKAEVPEEKMEVVKVQVNPDDDEDTAEMRRMMGFVDFKTTKNKKVPGNDRNFGVRKDKEMKARQYMNRTGGFNRPLSPSR